MLENKPNIPKVLEAMMRRQGYHFVGKHSAAKLCNYTTSSLKGGTTCYKNQFYGIRSWRCLQSAPTLGCDLACRFCWRIIPEEIGIKWNELNFTEWDDPKEIADGLINAQRVMLTGYKGNEKVDKKRLEEANDPAHVTFSLTGEPLFYPKMNELIEEFHKRKMSTFLVTNGTLPEALKKLKTLPTQLYVSVQAPNKEVYEKVTRPKIPRAWENFLEFLDIFSKLNTRRVFRLTLIKGLNMVDAKGYADLIRRGNPDYVEVKGFVYVGGARNPSRSLSYDLMPKKDDILNFANEIAEASGYIFTDYHKPSNVALLSKNEEIASKRLIHFEK
ncbi:MAG: 4-demethylwyosine synthase TYW1 [Candidatus Micrarchaeia archaeon]|jgi:tRNA wybutosine-synthesizing protein 1